MALGGVSATTLAVSASDGSREAKKGALKAVGAMWLTAAGMDAFYTYNGMAVSVPGWAGRAGRRATGGGIPAVPALRNLQAHQQTPFLPNQPHFCQTNRALQKKETNIATTAANTALGVLCLWRGFKKDSGGSSLAK
jgi:hypothetical protein